MTQWGGSALDVRWQSEEGVLLTYSEEVRGTALDLWWQGEKGVL